LPATGIANPLYDVANRCLRLPEQALPFLVVANRLAQRERNGPEHSAATHVLGHGPRLLQRRAGLVAPPLRKQRPALQIARVGQLDARCIAASATACNICRRVCTCIV